MKFAFFSSNFEVLHQNFVIFRENFVKNDEKSRNFDEKIAKIANGTRLLAHRSRSLRSRSLAHREKYRCAGTILRIVFSFFHGNALIRSRVQVCAHLNATVVSPFVHSVTPSVQRFECLHSSAAGFVN